METTILQGIRNVLFYSEWEIFDVCISKPGVIELADIEMELGSHRLEACNSQLHIRVSDIHLIFVAFAEKEIIT